MKRIFILLLVAAALIALFFSRSNNTIKEELRDFAIADASMVQKVYLADMNGEDVLLEKINGEWIVNKKHPAREDAVDLMLSTMERIAVKYPVGDQLHDNVIKSLATQAVKVEIYTEDLHKAHKTYYVGPEANDHLGSYMILENSSKAFINHLPGFNGFLGPRYNIDGIQVNAELWRDRSLLSYEVNELKSIEVIHHEAPQHSFLLTKENDSYLLTNGQQEHQVNPAFAQQYLSLFKSINIEGFMNEYEKRDSVRQSTPLYSLLIESKKGDQQVDFYHKKPKRDEYQDQNGNPLQWDKDRMYAFHQDDMMMVQFYVMNKILLSATDFPVEK
jgi:hypothetical protein